MKRYKLIYISVCLFFTSIISVSFFLKVPINVNSSAIIRPISEVSNIQSLVSGRIKESFIKENQTIKKGSIMFLMESSVHDERENTLLNRKRDILLFIRDIRLLLDESSPINLQTSFYIQALITFKQKQLDAITHLRKTTIDYERNKKLHNERVISDSEFEGYQYEFDRANNNLELIKKTQLTTWQNDLNNYDRELKDVQSQLIQLYNERENLIIRAPVSGTVQNLTTVYNGSLIFANQNLAQISPDTTLVVEAYVTPNDIGLINKNMTVRFRISSFNYNHWGVATGKAIEISNDIQILNDKPIFKVRCALDKDYLLLKNGYKGYLKKGMTVQASFMITQRTLWQLLYDKMDDWLNPNILPE